MESLRGYESNSDEDQSARRDPLPDREASSGAIKATTKDEVERESAEMKGPQPGSNLDHGEPRSEMVRSRSPGSGRHGRAHSPVGERRASSSGSHDQLHSPVHGTCSRSPAGRRESPYRHKRSPSPAHHRRSPPRRHKWSYSPAYRERSRSPQYRDQSHSPVHRRRSRSPAHHRRSRSPGRRKRSRSPGYRRRSRSPVHHKSRPSSYRRSSASSYRDRSRSPRRSPSLRSYSPRRRRSRSPVKGRNTSPSRRRESSDSRLHGESAGSTSSKQYRDSDSHGKPSASKQVPPVEDDNKTGKQLTPEEKLEQALVAAQALAPKLPSCMNPGAMNPIRYHNLQEKKKLLWSKKKEGPSRNKWEMASIEGEETQTTKFRRLMGISADKVNEQALKEESEQLKEKHAKTLSGLEEQYETSRYVTHVAKGAGLGYGSGSLLTELPSKTNTE